MSFLKRSILGEEADNAGNTEELYMTLFPKIGRDFVYKEDLEIILQQLLAMVNPALTATTPLRSSRMALRRANEYKALLNSGDTYESLYDLIELGD